MMTMITTYDPLLNSEVKLVGGKNNLEGNILIRGKPVCDDGRAKHLTATAQVVCRFIWFFSHHFLPSILRVCEYWTFPFTSRSVFLPRMLGYSGGEYTSDSAFGSVSDDFGMDEVQCNGHEASILDCPHDTWDDCGATEGLGVICKSATGENL